MIIVDENMKLFILGWLYSDDGSARVYDYPKWKNREEAQEEIDTFVAGISRHRLPTLENMRIQVDAILKGSAS